MSNLIDAVVVVLQVAGVAAVVYGLLLKLHADLTPTKTSKGLVAGN